MCNSSYMTTQCAADVNIIQFIDYTHRQNNKLTKCCSCHRHWLSILGPSFGFCFQSVLTCFLSLFSLSSCSKCSVFELGIYKLRWHRWAYGVGKGGRAFHMCSHLYPHRWAASIEGVEVWPELPTPDSLAGGYLGGECYFFNQSKVEPLF